VVVVVDVLVEDVVVDEVVEDVVVVVYCIEKLLASRAATFPALSSESTLTWHVLAPSVLQLPEGPTVIVIPELHGLAVLPTVNPAPLSKTA
jgi:hypothetical protein